MMVLRIAVFVLVAVALSSAADDKIIGGYECPPHSQPWQIFLTYDDGRRWCGASLISSRWAVSAAHCFIEAPRLALHLGEHHLFNGEGTEQITRAEKVIPHPDYNVAIDNDIMLIKLSEPAVFNDYVKPIELASTCTVAGEQCLVSGWGNLINTGVNYATLLQCLELPVVSQSVCEGIYGCQITQNLFCAGYMEGGKDPCGGDSGGPLVCSGKLKGIVSSGIGRCGTPGFPAVYTEVCRYIDWVNTTIANN